MRIVLLNENRHLNKRRYGRYPSLLKHKQQTQWYILHIQTTQKYVPLECKMSNIKIRNGEWIHFT